MGSGEPLVPEVSNLVVQSVKAHGDDGPVEGSEASLLRGVRLKDGQRSRGEVGPERRVDGGGLDAGEAIDDLVADPVEQVVKRHEVLIGVRVTVVGVVVAPLGVVVALLGVEVALLGNLVAVGHPVVPKVGESAVVDHVLPPFGPLNGGDCYDPR